MNMLLAPAIALMNRLTTPQRVLLIVAIFSAMLEETASGTQELTATVKQNAGNCDLASACCARAAAGGEVSAKAAQSGAGGPPG